MIRSRQLLPCPEDCPSRMYAFMVECWHEVIISVMRRVWTVMMEIIVTMKVMLVTIMMISLLVKTQDFQPQVPTRRPAFPEIHQRLRQWEGLGGR